MRTETWGDRATSRGGSSTQTRWFVLTPTPEQEGWLVHLTEARKRGEAGAAAGPPPPPPRERLLPSPPRSHPPVSGKSCFSPTPTVRCEGGLPATRHQDPGPPETAGPFPSRGLEPRQTG